jgi:hypothetical protein
VLRAGDAEGVSQPGPGQETLILRGLPVMQGGFILLLNGLMTWEPAVRSTESLGADESVSPELTASAPIEW